MENKFFVPLKIKHVDLDNNGNVVAESTKTYKLRVNTKSQREIKRVENIKPLELLLNPVAELSNNTEDVNKDNIKNMISKLPDTEYYTTLLYYALQQFHGEEFPTKESVDSLMDDYTMSGNQTIDLINILVEVYQISGLFPNASAQEVKPTEK